MSRNFPVWLLLIFCFTAASLPAAEPDSVTTNQAPTILIVGDSLSAGFGLRPGEAWPNLLEERLDSQGFGGKVVNASISGDTTRGALSRLPRALEVHAPDIVIIELGGNDGLRGFPLQVMRDNLAAMIKLSRDAGAHVLLLGMRLPPNYGQEYTEKFHAVYKKLAAERNVALVDFFLEDVAVKPELMQADGIHPTAEAQPVLLANVWPVLRDMLESLPGTDGLQPAVDASPHPGPAH